MLCHSSRKSDDTRSGNLAAGGAPAACAWIPALAAALATWSRARADARREFCHADARDPTNQEINQGTLMDRTAEGIDIPHCYTTEMRKRSTMIPEGGASHSVVIKPTFCRPRARSLAQAPTYAHQRSKFAQVEAGGRPKFFSATCPKPLAGPVDEALH